jgi:hypothetical protein
MSGDLNPLGLGSGFDAAAPLDARSSRRDSGGDPVPTPSGSRRQGDGLKTARPRGSADARRGVGLDEQVPSLRRGHESPVRYPDRLIFDESNR